MCVFVLFVCLLFEVHLRRRKKNLRIVQMFLFHFDYSSCEFYISHFLDIRSSSMSSWIFFLFVCPPSSPSSIWNLYHRYFRRHDSSRAFVLPFNYHDFGYNRSSDLEANLTTIPSWYEYTIIRASFLFFFFFSFFFFMS